MAEVSVPDGAASLTPAGGSSLLLFFSWLWVGVPLAWGVSRTITESLALFQ